MDEKLNEWTMRVTPRRPYYDDQPDGYQESDRDFDRRKEIERSTEKSWE
jgi:hypothetical protein